jgi:hypothetical protein
MVAESGIASSVLTQCHENSRVGESSHGDRDFLDCVGRLLRVDRPCFDDGRKNGLYSLIHLLLGQLRLGIFFVQLGQRLGSIHTASRRCPDCRVRYIRYLIRLKSDSPVEINVDTLHPGAH